MKTDFEIITCAVYEGCVLGSTNPNVYTLVVLAFQALVIAF